MENFKMTWFLTITFLCSIFHNLSEARHDKKLPSAVIVGTVSCDTCFQENFLKTSHFISGALVAVECGGTSSNPSFHEEVKTNEHGEFKVHLPISVAKHVRKIKGCSVKLISGGEPYCAVASTATSSSSLHPKSRNQQGTHIFSAGFFTFKPLKQPTLCNQKPSVQNFPPVTKIPALSKGMVSQKEFFWPIPQMPVFPSPPAASGIPVLPPNPLQPPSIFPPIPFQPPPSIFPPNPFQPSPPSIFPPNPFQPSPPSIFPPNPFRPIPDLTPPSPPPPAFPIPLPPFPFPPSPGIPPAASSSSKKTSP